MKSDSVHRKLLRFGSVHHNLKGLYGTEDVPRFIKKFRHPPGTRHHMNHSSPVCRDGVSVSCMVMGHVRTEEPRSTVGRTFGFDGNPIPRDKM